MVSTQVRRHLPALGLALLAGLAARLAWVYFIHPDPHDGRFDDTAWYRGAAHFIAEGQGHLNPFTGTTSAAWPPGYAFFLGGVFRLVGEGVAQTIAANVVVSLLTVAVVYAIGLMIFDRRTAAIAAVALALWPGQVYFASLTLSEPLFTLLFTLSVLLMLLVAATKENLRGALVIAFGVVTALAALTRGQAVMLLPFAVLYWAAVGYRWRPAVAWGLLAAVVAALTIAPWTVRNARELNAFVPISTNIGANIWIGNHEGASGRMTIEEAEPPQPDRGDLSQGEYEAAADRLALRKALGYIVTHPSRELELAGIKIRAMYESDATALDWNSAYREDYYASDSVEEGLRGLANGYWFAALALAGIGLIAARSQLLGPFGMLPALVLAWTALHVFFFGDARFHYPIVFAFALMGARGIVVLFGALWRPEPNLDRRYASA